MRKLIALLLSAVLLAGVLPALAEAPVKLTMGSWRADDTAQVQALLDKYAAESGVQIVFEPTKPTEYNTTLELQLKNGTGPDLMYARSYSVSEGLFDAGYLMDLSDIEEIKANFPDTAYMAWAKPDGTLFGVPYASVSQVVYYNKTIFKDNGIEVPTTFEDFLKACETLKNNGVEPLANGIAENWDILECVLCGMVPNYIGGMEGRALYESGEKKFNSEEFVAALTDFAALAKYLPDGFEALNNSDGPPMFGMGRAAMFIDGSWTSGAFDGYPDLDWGTFAIPAPAGKDTAICVHKDMGIAGNAATKHPEEVKAFLRYLATPEGAAEATAILPAGFFPLINNPAPLGNPKAQEIYELAEGKVQDSRFLWNKYMDMYTDFVDQLNLIARGQTTPQAAADALAEIQTKLLAK